MLKKSTIRSEIQESGNPVQCLLILEVLIFQVEDFISLSQTPLDGSQLTDIMHNR